GQVDAGVALDLALAQEVADAGVIQDDLGDGQAGGGGGGRRAGGVGLGGGRGRAPQAGEARPGAPPRPAAKHHPAQPDPTPPGQGTAGRSAREPGRWAISGFAIKTRECGSGFADGMAPGSGAQKKTEAPLPEGKWEPLSRWRMPPPLGPFPTSHRTVAGT